MAHSDFGEYMRAQELTRRRWAEYEAAGAHLEVARVKERAAELLSQHQPVADWGIDREKLRSALDYVLWGRMR